MLLVILVLGKWKTSHLHLKMTKVLHCKKLYGNGESFPIKLSYILLVIAFVLDILKVLWIMSTQLVRKLIFFLGLSACNIPGTCTCMIMSLPRSQQSTWVNVCINTSQILEYCKFLHHYYRYYYTYLMLPLQ